MVEGLRRPDAGEVRLLGEPPWPRNQRLLPRIGVQLQASAFFERLTAREQIRTFASLYGVPAGAGRRVAGAGRARRQGRHPHREAVRRPAAAAAIACALVHDPEVVFLDEPTAALDPQARRNLWDLLRSLNDAGRTVVLTTHYMDEAEALCDRVAIMDHGRILRAGHAGGPGTRARRAGAGRSRPGAPGERGSGGPRRREGPGRGRRGADHPRPHGGARPRWPSDALRGSRSGPRPSRTSEGSTWR